MIMHTIYCKSRGMARRHYPCAVRIVKVDGGYIAFDTRGDYTTWRGQK